MSKEILNIDGNVRKLQKETLTPYKIAIVLLIKEYCNETTKVIVERRDFCLAALKLIQSPDMELTTLMNTLCSSEYVLLRFGHQMEVQLNLLSGQGIEGLLDLFDSLGRLTKPSSDHPLALPALNKNSVLGLYVRRVMIYFEKLSFDRMVILYDSLKDYIDRRYSNSNATDTSISLQIDESINYKPKSGWGVRQAQLLIAQQANALQTDEHKAMSPIELNNFVRDLLGSSPYYPEAHYLSYLNYLRVNEYNGAIDSLYHCFDTLTPLEYRPSIEDKPRTFRYAALNLAVLHAQFDHKEIAKAALKEAIMMAQEAGDNICLQLAHAWMYYLTSEQKGTLIERSIGKSSMLGITHTTGLGLIAHAHYSALEGKTPSQVFETLLKSDVLNCQHSMLDLTSMTCAEKSALWAYYGKTELSSVCSQLLLLYNTGDKKQHMFNGPSTCQTVINIANILMEFGEYNYVDVVLSHAKKRFPNEPCNKIWMLCEQLYNFTQMMMHEKWNEAEAIAQDISSLDAIESKFRQAEVCLAKFDYIKGLELINSIVEKKIIVPQSKVRAMILQSQLISAAVQPRNGNTGINSIVLLNDAIELTEKYHLSYYQSLVKMHLANLQLIIGLPTLALNLVEDTIVSILAHGGCYDQGRALVLYAKCLVATAPTSKCQERREAILSAINSLSKAKEHFSKVNALGKIRATLFLESIFYNEIDFKSERNQCSFEFQKMDEQLSTKMYHLSLY